MPDIELTKIKPNKLNPRTTFSKSGLDELALSIKNTGVIEPIVLRPFGKGQYEVVVGERRYRAALQAGLKVIPSIVRECSDNELIELNIIENVQREELSAIEKAKICKGLKDDYPAKYPTWKEVADVIGVSERTVHNWLETLKVPNEIQKYIAPKTEVTGKVPSGKIDYSTAIRIAGRINNPLKQVEVAQNFANKHVGRTVGNKILKEIGKKPNTPVKQIFQEVVDEAPINLPFSKTHADAIKNGRKTQTTRKAKDPRLQVGTIVRAQITHFADLRIINVYRKKLKDFDESDAQREGGYTLEQFKEVWKSLHDEWNPDETVYVIEYKLEQIIGEPESTA